MNQSVESKRLANAERFLGEKLSGAIASKAMQSKYFLSMLVTIESVSFFSFTLTDLPTVTLTVIRTRAQWPDLTSLNGHVYELDSGRKVANFQMTETTTEIGEID